MDAGTRNVYSNKPVTKPEDLKGQKIRMMGNPLFVETMNAMGGNGVAMGFNELSARCRPAWSTARRTTRRRCWRRTTTLVSKVYSLTGHLIIPEIFVFSKRTWDALTRGPGAGAEAVARGADRAAPALGRDVGERRDQAQGQGREVRPADKAAFYKATQPIRDKYGAKYAALLKRIEETK